MTHAHLSPLYRTTAQLLHELLALGIDSPVDGKEFLPGYLVTASLAGQNLRAKLFDKRGQLFQIGLCRGQIDHALIDGTFGFEYLVAGIGGGANGWRELRKCLHIGQGCVVRR